MSSWIEDGVAPCSSDGCSPGESLASPATDALKEPTAAAEGAPCVRLAALAETKALPVSLALWCW